MHLTDTETDISVMAKYSMQRGKNR